MRAAHRPAIDDGGWSQAGIFLSGWALIICATLPYAVASDELIIIYLFFFCAANPAPLGLFAFGLTTALLQGGNTAITEASTRFLVYGYALFFGGLAQLLAGMWEFKRQNTFGATAFTCKFIYFLLFLQLM